MKITEDIIDSSSLSKRKSKGRFVLDLHLFPTEESLEPHWDIKYNLDSTRTEEIAFLEDPSIGLAPHEGVRLTNYESDWDKVKDKGTKKVFWNVETELETIDSGEVEIVESNNDVMFTFYGKRLNGNYRLHNDDGQSIFVRQISTQNLEENPDQLTIWVEINKVDVPGREVHGSIFSPKGKENAVLGVFSDEIIKGLLARYSNGENIFLMRLYNGYIIQVMTDAQK